MNGNAANAKEKESLSGMMGASSEVCGMLIIEFQVFLK